MSLQVWLPLTKDLRQQGLSNVTVTNSGTTYSSTDGKLGGCYIFDGTDDRISCTAKTWNYPISIGAWFKPTDVTNTNTQYWLSYNTSTGGTSGHAIGIGTYQGKLAVWYGGTVYNSFTQTLSNNNWYHIAVTISSDKQLKTYLNGENIDTRTFTNSNPGSTFFTIGARSNSASGGSGGALYFFKGSMNDARLYDHCLSPMEVKELAKGLVLHYNFSDDNLESTTNLVTREDGLSDTCYNGATGKYSYGTNTDIYKTVGTFQNRKSTKVYMGTAGLNAYPYVYFDAFNAAGTVIQTLSFDYYPTLQNTLIPYSYNGAYNFSYTTNNTSGSANNVSQIIIPVEVGKWNHITITAQKADTTNTSRGVGYIRIGSASHTSTTTNYWLFSSIQVEAKNHATGYAGVGGTRNSTTVYDCSGFSNNGTISGALTISNDTPKYSYSIQMPAATTITHDRCLDNTDQEWSCAAWVNPTVAGNYQNLNNFNVSNRLYHGTYPLLYLNSGTNDYYNYGNLALPANQWSHIVFVFKNSTGTKLIYINGENHTNTGGPNKTSMPAGIPDSVIIGSGNYEGGLCDYREYATALSAEDVKSLYQNSAYIDSSGNIYGTIHEV